MNCFICTYKHACIYVRMFVHTYIKSHVAVCLRRGEDSNLYVVVSGTHFPSDWMFASAAIHAYIMKFRLVQYDKFYGGEKQEDASECLTMLIELINKDSVPYYGSNHNYSTGVSLSEILFSFMLEKYIACDACGLRSPSVEPSCVLYITPTVTSMQELIKQGMEQKWEKSCFRCKKNTWHVESNYILQLPKYLIVVVNRFRYSDNFTKDRCSIPMDMTVVLGLHEFSLQATIDHHVPSMYLAIILPLSTVAKEHSIATTAKLRSLKWLIPKTPLLLMW